jgi:hypothetical protein
MENIEQAMASLYEIQITRRGITDLDVYPHMAPVHVKGALLTSKCMITKNLKFLHR